MLEHADEETISTSVSQPLLPHSSLRQQQIPHYHSLHDNSNIHIHLLDNSISHNNHTRSTASSGSIPIFTIACILSTAFSYGCILTTLFLITLPMECQRIHASHGLPKSVLLGSFIAVAGVTQLIAPLLGRLSDHFEPPMITTTKSKKRAVLRDSTQQEHTSISSSSSSAIPMELGQRLPYLVLGSIGTVMSLLGQLLASATKRWTLYGVCFVTHMMGLTCMYTMMMVLIPDQIPKEQTGMANGILALQLVLGSLFGFGLLQYYYTWYEQSLSMYSVIYPLYICVVIVSTILTGLYGHERDVQRMQRQWQKRVKRQFIRESGRRYEAVDHVNGMHFKTHTAMWTPSITTILRSMLIDPFTRMDWATFKQSYMVNRKTHYDFFHVTLSRLFYYCGMSVQTFFLYFLKDRLHIQHHTATAVAKLAILGQCAAAITCYPVGVWSDRYCHGRRKPFVYVACVVLSVFTAALVTAQRLQEMIVYCLVLGAANGVYLTMETSLAVDTLPHETTPNDEDNNDDDKTEKPNGNISNQKDDEEETGSAQLLGVWGVAAFLGATLGPLIGGPLLYVFGHAQCDETRESDCAEREEHYSIEGYAVVIGLSSFYYLLSAVTLCWVGNEKR